MSGVNLQAQQYYEKKIARLHARNAELEASHLVETRAINRYFIDRIQQLTAERQAAVDNAAHEHEREVEDGDRCGRGTGESRSRVEAELGQKLAESEQEKAGLKKRNSQLVREVERLTTDRARVSDKYWKRYQARAAECDELSSQLDMYHAAWSEQAELLEHDTPPLALPLEVIATIASFVAGSNHFATLGSLCRTSKFLQYECERVLWEMVPTVWNGNEKYDRVRAHATAGTSPAPWKLIRFILASDTSYPISEAEVRAKAYPNLEALIIPSWDALEPDRWPHDAVTARYSARIEVLKDTTVQALGPILRYPMRWGSEQHPSSAHEGLVSRHPILGIESVNISSGAILSCGTDPSRTLLVPSECGLRIVNIAPGDPGLTPEAQIIRLETTIRTLSHFVRPTSASPAEPFITTIICRRAEDVDVWLRELPKWMALNPRMRPRFDFYLGAEMTAQQFTEYTLRFSRLYKDHWVDTYQGRETGTQEEPFFTSYAFQSDGEFEDDPEQEADFDAVFYRPAPTVPGFFVLATHPWSGEEIYHEHWIPAGVAVRHEGPVIGDEGEGEYDEEHEGNIEDMGEGDTDDEE